MGRDFSRPGLHVNITGPAAVSFWRQILPGEWHPCPEVLCAFSVRRAHRYTRPLSGGRQRTGARWDRLAPQRRSACRQRHSSQSPALPRKRRTDAARNRKSGSAAPGSGQPESTERYAAGTNQSFFAVSRKAGMGGERHHQIHQGHDTEAAAQQDIFSADEQHGCGIGRRGQGQQAPDGKILHKAHQGKQGHDAKPDSCNEIAESRLVRLQDDYPALPADKPAAAGGAFLFFFFSFYALLRPCRHRYGARTDTALTGASFRFPKTACR